MKHGAGIDIVVRYSRMDGSGEVTDKSYTFTNERHMINVLRKLVRSNAFLSMTFMDGSIESRLTRSKVRDRWFRTEAPGANYAIRG